MSRVATEMKLEEIQRFLKELGSHVALDADKLGLQRIQERARTYGREMDDVIRQVHRHWDRS